MTMFISKIPAKIDLLKVKNRNIRESYKICSKLTIKTPERCHRRHRRHILDFEQVNVNWVLSTKCNMLDFN